MTEPGHSSTDRNQAPPPPPSADADETQEPAGRRPPIGDTVGTGTSIALGCVAATLLLIVIGLIFLVIVVVVS